MLAGLLVGLASFSSSAQTPTVSYSTPQTYYTGVAITPLTPTSTNVVASNGFLNRHITIDSAMYIATEGMAIDGQDNLYVTDYTDSAIYQIPAGATHTLYLIAKIPNVVAVTIDKNGNLYASSSKYGDPANGFVYKITPGRSISVIGSGFNDPKGLVVDAQGDVYVADEDVGELKEIPVSGGPWTVVGNFPNIQALAIDAAGYIYTVDGDSEIVKIPPGNGTPIPVPASVGFVAPTSMAVDNLGNIFINENNALVYEVPVNGGPVIPLPIGDGGIQSIVVDRTGHVYVNGGINFNGDQAVLKFTPSGGYYVNPALPAGLTLDGNTGIISGTPTLGSAAKNYVVTAYNTFGGSGSTTVNIGVISNVATLSGLGVSTGAVLSPSFDANTLAYHIYVSLTTTSIKLTPTATDPSAAIKVNGVTILSGKASAPVSLVTGDNVINTVVTSADGTVTKTYAVTVTREQTPSLSYSSPQTYYTGVPISPLVPTSTSVVPANGFLNKHLTIDSAMYGNSFGMAIDGQDNLYVTDHGANAVYQIPAGKTNVLTKVATIANPVAVATDSHGNLYVSAIEFGYPDAGFVYKIAPGGSPVVIGSGFTDPRGLVVDAQGDVYVAETNANDVKEIPAGGGPSIVVGTFYNCQALAIDAAGYIYTTSASGIYKIPPGNGTPVQVPASMSFVAQTSMAVDNLGNIFINNNNNQVYEVPVGGGPVIQLPVNNNGIEGIAIDRTGHIYVNGSINFNRVQGVLKITPSGGYYVTPTLPAGLTLDGSTGIISGTPTAVSPATNYTVLGYNATGSRGSTNVSIKVLQSFTGLANLTTSAGTLSPAFNSDTLTYNFFVPATTSSLRVTPTRTQIGSTILVNGHSVPSGTASAAIPIAIDTTTAITVSTTSADNSSTITYTLNISRVSPIAANLANLQVNGHATTPAFVANVTSYSLTVPPNVQSVTFYPVLRYTTSTVTVNGSPAMSRQTTGPVYLNPGPNPIPIVVTAADGITTKTYTVNVTRDPGDSISTLKSLVFSGGGTMTPAFNSDSTHYYIYEPTNTSEVKITATGYNPYEIISINDIPQPSGVPTAPNSLYPPGYEKHYNIDVSSSDGTHYTQYVVVVNRTPAISANLANLAVSTGTLSPAFSADITSYTVNTTASTIRITPVLRDTTSTVTINNTPVQNRHQSPIFLLRPGINVYGILVTTAGQTASKSYLLNVNVPLSGQNIFVATNSNGLNLGTALSGDNAGTEDNVFLHPALTPDGDGVNDFLKIDNIEAYPKNKLVIMDGKGTKVFEASGYDNSNHVFDGRSSLTGQRSSPGTYFYKLQYEADGVLKNKTGYIVLKY